MSATNYSNVEWLDMVRFYAIAGDNLAEARRLYAEPSHLAALRRQGILNPQIPRAATILAATQRLLDYGQFTVPNHAQGRGIRPQYTAAFEERILEYFERKPRNSIRDAARRFNVSKSYVWRLLNRLEKHPFHFRRTQALLDADPQERISLCMWLLNNPEVNILWTDESTFTRVGMFNIHNEHYWAFNNPHLIKEHSHQIRFSVNVWAGIINEVIIGPVFIEGNLNGATYLDMLITTIPELLEGVPLAYLRELYYQHDGCPAHYVVQVRAYLDAEFSERWIGRGGPVAWPARSPDLTPLDFFLWSEVKRLVYTHEATSRDQLKQKILSAFDKIRRETNILRKLKDNLQKRARLCIEVNGRHFEHLLQYM